MRDICCKEKEKMEKEIIFFKEKQPTEVEASRMIEHFCKEHCRTYKKLKKASQCKIEGNIYNMTIERKDTDFPAYWMIHCALAK